MAQEQFLERNGRRLDRRGEAQRSSTDAANGPGRDLQHEYSSVADAALGVDGSVAQADRDGGRANAGADLPGKSAFQIGECQVDGLFEVGTIERIGLVEDRQRLQPAVGHAVGSRHVDARG